MTTRKAGTARLRWIVVAPSRGFDVTTDFLITTSKSEVLQISECELKQTLLIHVLIVR